jgi:two-component system cell cycle response regulator
MPGRILIIEDHADNLELMNYLLKAFGHTTVAAGDGLCGLEMAQHGKADLIICDIQLPGIDGYEIAKRLKQDPQLRAIPLVGITALAMVGDRERVLAAGFDGYIAKPIMPETFVHDVESFLTPEQRLASNNPAAATNGFIETPAREPLDIRGTILVVDNVPANLELARSIFEPSGYHVLLAEDVAGAITLAKRARPDLVLSDINMPEASGFELAMRIKSDPELKPIPVVLISATVPRDMSADHALSVGAAKFLLRPIDPHVLLAEIESCLPAKTKPIAR